VQLRELGWNSYFEEQWLSKDRTGMTPARIVEEQRQAYRVISDAGEHNAEITGHLRHAAVDRSDLPAVGDWVSVHFPSGESKALIHEVLPRRSRLSRKVAGDRLDEQIIVANVDTVMIVTSLNGDLNPRRIERYMAAVWESGAQPVLVLSKSDLCTDPISQTIRIARVAPGAGVHVVCALTDQGLDELTPYFGTGSTVVLVGSSGVGKSTLINRLLQSEVQITRSVREGDDRGRHATTYRRLFPLPGGGVLIDTPGIRELQLWEGEGLNDTFSEIQQLALRCKFTDCRHQSEPGCAILKAIEENELDTERLENYYKLQRELAHLEIRRDPAAQSERKKLWKKRAMAYRRQNKGL
jgi:ribosome biogenesis GTPase